MKPPPKPDKKQLAETLKFIEFLQWCERTFLKKNPTPYTVHEAKAEGSREEEKLN